MLWIGIGVCLLILALILFRRSGDVEEETRQTGEIAAKEEGETVGNLIDALENVQDTASFRRLQDRLALQLFRLTPMQAEQLNRKQKRALRRQLQFSLDSAWPVYRDVPFVMALLQGISSFDDAETLQVVTQLADRSSQPQVRQAAIKCRDILEVRVGSRRLRRRLVRSATDPSQTPDSLLRAQSGSERDNDQCLVRPLDRE